jgi:hypothetical protein
MGAITPECNSVYLDRKQRWGAANDKLRLEP